MCVFSAALPPVGAPQRNSAALWRDGAAGLRAHVSPARCPGRPSGDCQGNLAVSFHRVQSEPCMKQISP